MPYVKLNDREYELSTKLRVAYRIQGQHNHKPYAEIFRQIGSMGVEQQVGMLYAAFEIANPQEAKFDFPKQAFLDALLDNYNLQDMVKLLTEVIAGLMGKDPEELKKQNDDAAAGTDTAAEDSEDSDDPF